jgi:uncharacterized membrane protein YjgN (DUF898 family)
MRYVVGGAFAFTLALVQASSIEQFRILGVAPNLMLVMLVAWLVVRGLDDVLPMVAVAGVTLGFVGLQTPGLILFALLAPLALFGIVRELKIIHSESVLLVSLVLAASLMYETIVLGGVMATGGVFDLRSGFVDVVLPAAIVNLAIALPVYVVMRLARPSAPRRRNVYSF